MIKVSLPDYIDLELCFTARIRDCRECISECEKEGLDEAKKYYEETIKRIYKIRSSVEIIKD